MMWVCMLIFVYRILCSNLVAQFIDMVSKFSECNNVYVTYDSTLCRYRHETLYHRAYIELQNFILFSSPR